MMPMWRWRPEPKTSIRKKTDEASPLFQREMRVNLRDYPRGTRIAIADRNFIKTESGSFWREELGTGSDRVTELPAVTLEAIERDCHTVHEVLPTSESQTREPCWPPRIG